MTVGLTQVHPKTLQLPEWLSLKQKLETCYGQVIFGIESVIEITLPEFFWFVCL